MAATYSQGLPANPAAPRALARPRTLKAGSSTGEASSSSAQVAHTLTACTRCRQRKSRCDPGLPRCGPCERTNSVCEYYDSNKGHNVNRSYVVYLQHKVRELEEELDKLENEDAAEDPEAMMRAANVNIHTEKESKFLGPSSGIAITRLVMQLAKQFTDATTIRQIVPAEHARQIKVMQHEEEVKPTSKIYPLISDVAAVDLPNRFLTNGLVTLYKLKVQPMYPALHEPTLDADVDAVYQDSNTATSYQNFVVRMVIAISLQKMDTQYAGLADSYYLAALKHLEPVVKAMNLKTLQCFALMAEYSLLTPTRTAIFYVVGIAVRLVQSLGYNEEKTITRPRADGKVDFLEIDMRRRLFYCTVVMDFGLSHSIGRPAMLATNWDHVDVGWFETCDDKFITPDGVDPAAERPTLKKWVAIHFFKMRMLQLEIRRKLYLKKRPDPKSDTDPWFIGMEAKLMAWRDAAPSADEGFGLNKIWFIGRYNTMVVFLFRPSPQVPRPSLDAAMKCFEACEYNINLQRNQIDKKTVDLTWIFTQAIFMAINTMLWSLSYEEVRRKYDRETVESTLDIAMETIGLASERWPGVASAVKLYQNLISAILQIYEKDGDVPISAASPSEIAASPPANFPEGSRSQTTSPSTVASSSVATPPERPHAPFGYINQQARGVSQSRPQQQPPQQISQPQPQPYQQYQHEFNANANVVTPPPREKTPVAPSSSSSSAAYHIAPTYNDGLGMQNPYQNPLPQQNQQQQHPQQHYQYPPQPQQKAYFDPYTQYNALPEFTPDLTIPGWSAAQPQQSPFAQAPIPLQSHFGQFSGSIGNASHPVFDPMNPAYPFPATLDTNMAQQYMGFHPPDPQQQQQQQQSWDMDAGFFGAGLTQVQQEELMQSLETEGMEDIQSMISSTLSSITPKAAQGPGFQ